MARPKKAPDELRDDRLPNIRVTAGERAFVEEQAANAGLPLVEYCRSLILRKRIKPRVSDTEAQALVELNRAGVNLNQIARAVNRGQDLPPDFAGVLADLHTAIMKVAGHGS